MTFSLIALLTKPRLQLSVLDELALTAYGLLFVGLCALAFWLLICWLGKRR